MKKYYESKTSCNFYIMIFIFNYQNIYMANMYLKNEHLVQYVYQRED